MTKAHWSDRKMEWFMTGWIEGGAISPKEIWALWGSRINVIEGAHEACPTTGRMHWHYAIQFKTVMWRKTMVAMFHNPVGVYSFDPMYDKSNWEAMKVYATKDGDTYQKFGKYKITAREQANQQLTKRQALFEDIQNGMKYKECWYQHRDAMSHCERNAKIAIDVFNTKTVKSKYKLNDFKLAPITDWSKSIVLRGPTHIGKTSYAMAHFTCPLFLSDINGLKHFDEDVHDGIIFDDMNFRSLDREKQIHLLDIDFERDIRILFQVVTIPAETKKIFTTNVGDSFLWADEAIASRARVMDVTLEDLRGESGVKV